MLGQFCRYSPADKARVLPHQWLEELSQLNKEFGLGTSLCKSRAPDFLNMLMTRTGVVQSIPWLKVLVERAPAILDILPLPAVCELFIARFNKNASGLKVTDAFDDRCRRVLGRALSDGAGSGEVAVFFCKRMHSTDADIRCKAWLCLEQLMLAVPSTSTKPQPNVGHACGWLVQKVPMLPNLSKWIRHACEALCKAMQLATQSSVLLQLCVFVCTFVEPKLHHTVLEAVSNLIITRVAARRHLLGPRGCRSQLLQLFQHYMSSRSNPPIREEVLVVLPTSTGEIKFSRPMLCGLLFILSAPHAGERAHFDMAARTLLAPPHAATMVSRYLQALQDPALVLAMLRSGTDELVSCALCGMQPRTLLTAIGSFGRHRKVAPRIIELLLAAATSDANALQAVYAALGEGTRYRIRTQMLVLQSLQVANVDKLLTFFQRASVALPRGAILQRVNVRQVVLLVCDLPTSIRFPSIDTNTILGMVSDVISLL